MPGKTGKSIVHPDDEPEMTSMTTEFGDGATPRVLRLRALDGGWTPIHVTVHRVELDEDTYAGLLSLRLPTEAELNPAPSRPPAGRRARAEKAARA